LRRFDLENRRRFAGACDYLIIAALTFAAASTHALRAEAATPAKRPATFYTGAAGGLHVMILRLLNWRAVQSHLIPTRRARP